MSPQSRSVTITPPAGYRRARREEVTAAAARAAQEALVFPLGTFVEREGFGIGVETHFDNIRGEHKGASVFLPAWSPVVPMGDTVQERIVTIADGYADEWERLDEAGRAGLVAYFWRQATGSQEGFEHSLPWSAVFVVTVLRQAGPGLVPLTARHTDYARAALTGTGYEAHDARTFAEVEPGDLVLKPREGGSETFEDLANPAGFDSHADIVIEVEPGWVRTIGGNKAGGSVGVQSYQRNPDGTIAAPVIAVLHLRNGSAIVEGGPLA